MKINKILLVMVLICIIIVIFLVNRLFYFSNLKSDFDVRHLNLKTCLDFIDSFGKDGRHKNITKPIDCYNFYLSTPTQTLIDDYND